MKPESHSRTSPTLEPSGLELLATIRVMDASQRDGQDDEPPGRTSECPDPIVSGSEEAIKALPLSSASEQELALKQLVAGLQAEARVGRISELQAVSLPRAMSPASDELPILAIEVDREARNSTATIDQASVQPLSAEVPSQAAGVSGPGNSEPGNRNPGKSGDVTDSFVEESSVVSGPRTLPASRRPKSWNERLHSRQWWFDLAWHASCVAAMIALALLVNQWLFRGDGSASADRDEDSLIEQLNQARQGAGNLEPVSEVNHVKAVGPVGRIVGLLPADETVHRADEATYIDGPLTQGMRDTSPVQQVSGELDTLIKQGERR